MKNNYSKSIVLGGLIVLAGVLFLLFNLGVLPAEWRSIIISWQMLLIVLGIVGICYRSYIGGIVLIAVGGIFMLPELSYVLGFTYSPALVNEIVWPSVIILAGLIIIFSKKCFHHHFSSSEESRKHGLGSFTSSGDGMIDYNLIFNGIDEVYLEPEFKGGEINTVFGGAKLDLRRTCLPVGDTHLEVSSIFGGVSILVPPEWNVRLVSESVFGSFSDRRPVNGPVSDRRLLIEASSIFGGGSVE